MYLVKHALLALPLAAALTVIPQTASSQTNHPACSSASSDADGDGWGWENNRTCVVGQSAVSSGVRQVASVTSGASGSPVCSSSSFDPDGDGFGWENNTTCVVTQASAPAQAAAPTQAAASSSNGMPVCSSSSFDPDGDGFGWENNRTCVVTSNSSSASSAPPVSSSSSGSSSSAPDRVAVQPIPAVAAANAGSRDGRPICLTNSSDVDNSGFGYENNRTCVVVAGVTATRTDPLLNRRICEDWFEIPYGNFRLQNNVWNARGVFSNNWTQCITLNGSASRPVASWDYNWLGRTQGNEFAVKSYPQVYYGRKTRFNQSGTVAETGLPAPVTGLPRFTVDFAYSETGNAERNVAFESFFHYSREAEENNKHFEMMIWVGVPDTRTPGPIVTSARIDGRDWDVHVNPSLGWGYVAFVAQNPFTSGSLDWNAFVDWTLNNGPAFGVPRLASNTWMGAIELGTETFWGAGTFTVDRLNVRRN